MTEQSMFFSDGSYYSQNVFARFIKDIFGHDGVVTGIDNELEVTANTPTNMAVNVNTGRSYIKGYFHEILTDPVSLTIPDADETNDRIDRIILRLDVDSTRKIIACVLEGTPAASPVPPTLTQTDSIWEISLAKVAVSASAVSITSGDITDERDFMSMNRVNMPKASKTAIGSVKIGDGINVSDGVISTAGTTAPVHAEMYDTDKGYGILIKNNAYTGTVGTVPMGLTFTNTGLTTAKSETITGRFSSDGDSGTGTYEIRAVNCFTGAYRLLTTWSVSVSSGGSTTRTLTTTIAYEEIVNIVRTATSTQPLSYSLALSPNNYTYVGTPS